MELNQAFGIQNKEVVSFVGGGGKTTAMFRLAAELSDAGKRVVTTTTTRIFASQMQNAPRHIFATDADQVLRDVTAALGEGRHVLVVGEATEEGKALGIDPALVDRLIGLDEVDVILNEADGSRTRPFKAPGEHEPVIPDSATLLVPVVGIDAVGAPLDADHVHRPEQVAALSGAPLGAALDPQIIARVITSPDGGLKNRPPGARVIPLINKAANVAQLLIARDLAALLMQSPAIHAVAIGAVKNISMPITELHQRVAAIVLAAGGSTRMQGALKQLLPWGRTTLLGRSIEVARRTEIAEIIVVVGRRADDVRRQAQATGVRVIENPDWERGRSTSIRTGLSALGPEIAAAVFVNADQPFLTPAVIDTLIQRYFHTLAPIVVPLYDGQSGSPVLFAREMFAQLLTLEGEEGGRDILRRVQDEAEFVNVINTLAAIDVDTPEQYQAALEQAETNPPEAIMSTVSHGEK